MKKTCYPLDNNHLRITGFLERMIGVCCEAVHEAEIPSAELADTPEESFKNWENMIAQIHAESDFELCDRKASKACHYCPKYLPAQRKPHEKIRLVNIAMYPSPCQADCIYCDLRENGHFEMADSEKINKIYKNVIDLCNYLKENDKLDDEVMFQISSGEIAIHPFKDEILDVVGNMTADFYSNGMKFDEDIAKKLNRNPKSRILVSLDAGTAETWAIVKRRDNFKKTIDNLTEYRKYTTNDDQIELKYIVMPGINTAEEDFDGIVEIMKMLNVPRLVISKNFWKSEDEESKLLEEFKRLILKLIENNLEWNCEFALSFEDLNTLNKFETDFKRRRDLEQERQRKRETITICTMNQAFIGEDNFPGFVTIQVEAFDDKILLQIETQNFELSHYLQFFNKTLEEAINFWELEKTKLPEGLTLEIKTTDTHIIIKKVSNYSEMSCEDLETLLLSNRNFLSLRATVGDAVITKNSVCQHHSRIFKASNFEQEFESIKLQITANDFEKVKALTEDKELILFGAHVNNGFTVNKLIEMGIIFHGVCDTDAEKKTCTTTGMTVISPQELVEKHSEALVLIAINHIDYKALNDVSFPEEQIIPYPHESGVIGVDYFMSDFYDGYKNAYESLTDNESRRVLLGMIRKYLLDEKISRSSGELKYFDNDVIQLKNDEIFVDGGAFYGNTVYEFVNKCQENQLSYKKVYAFEPDSEACYKTNDEQFNIPKIEIINNGLWSENTDLTFYKTGAGTASAVWGHGGETITAPVITLDSFFEDMPESEWPTFIKLDVEGAEQQVLNGARKIITEKRPKMAICTYHMPHDIFKIIEITKECNPNYEFTLRQHGDSFYEQVLYCVDRS